MTGHYSRSCHITMHNMHKMWGLIENSAYVMPHVTTFAVTSCMYCVVHAQRQAGHPYVNVVHQKLLVDMPFAPAKLYPTKLTT